MGVVNKIRDETKAGRRKVAEFWISSERMFIHIRYFAVGDDEIQDLRDIRSLVGQRRLLDWG